MEKQSAKAAFGVEEAGAYLGVSRPTIYRLLGQGTIPSFHIGRRRLLLKEHLERFLQERLAEARGGR